MTDDLDRRAALLMGLTGCAFSTGHYHLPERPCAHPSARDMAVSFSPTTNPADTRALAMFMVGKGYAVETFVCAVYARAIIWDLTKVIAQEITHPSDGPNYPEIAQTRAFIAALGWALEASKEAQDV